MLGLLAILLITAYGNPTPSCDAYFAQGRYARAEICYRDALESDDSPIETVIRLALTLQKESRLAQAEALFQRAVVFEESAANLNNLATVYHDEGRLAESNSSCAALLRRVSSKRAEAGRKRRRF